MFKLLPSPFPKRLLLFGLLLSVAAVACNLPYEYRDAGPLPTLHRASYEVMQEHSSPPQIVLAGFPKSFYVQTRLREHTTSPNISVGALLQNIALWVGILVCTFCYELYVSRPRQETKKRLGRSISLLDLLLALGIVAAILAMWRQLDSRYAETRKLASLIGSQRGEARSAVFLPQVASKWMPTFIKKRFAQIYDVRLENPNKQILDQVLSLRMLQHLRIGGGEIDTSVTSRIGQLPLLWDLRLSGTRLQPADITNLSAVADRLVALNLMRTNITWQGLDAFGEMPRLKHLGLSHTNCRMSELRRPAWSKTVQELVLPHPPPGETDTLEIDDWPALRRLAVVEFDEVKNATPVLITLSNMAALDELLLDPLQNFVLHLNNVSLTSVEYFDAQLSARSRNPTDVPGSLYLSKFEIDRAPNLTEMSVFGPELKSYRISGAPRLKFGIGTFFYGQRSPLEVWSYAASGMPYRSLPNATPIAVRQGWLDCLAECEGPPKVDFSAIDLRGCDLAPLARNNGLRSVDLSLTDIQDELHSLKSDCLTDLLLNDLPVNNALLNKLVVQIPSLKRVEISPDQLQRLRLRDMQSLRSIFMSGNDTMLNVSEIDVRNLPEFEETIVASRLLSECNIVNTPKLRGINIKYPLPEKSTLRGFKSLVKFGAGGPQVDDAVFSELLRCKRLETLLLSHASISRDAFLSLSSLPELKHLCLYGCNVDDAVVKEIAKLSNLETLTLDYTNVSDASSNVLAQLQQLKVLRIDATPLAQSDLSFLPQLGELRELRIGGATLDRKLLSILAQVKGLKHLELTGGRLTKEAVDELIKSAPLSIRLLGLRDIKQPRLDISDLPSQYIEFDITNAEFTPNTIDAFDASGRAHDFRELPFDMAPLLGARSARAPNSYTTLSFHPEVFRPGYVFHPSANPQQSITQQSQDSVTYFAPGQRGTDVVTTILPPVLQPQTSPASPNKRWESLFYWLGHQLGKTQRWATTTSEEGPRDAEF